MIAMRTVTKKVSLAWTPGHTIAGIVAVALAIGFLPFVKMGLVVNGLFLGAIIAWAPSA